MIRTERRDDGLVYVVAGLSELMSAIVDERRTTASWRELPHHGDGQSHAFVFETRLTDGARIVGEYVPDELPGFRALDVGAPEATPEDQKRIADEYRAIPPIIPAQD